MKYLFLFLSITFEVAGTLSMKLSQGFSNLSFSIMMFVFYCTSLGFLTLSLKYFEISIVYAIWSGLGVSLISIVGILYFDEKINIVKIICLLLIILGVVGLSLNKK